MASSAGTMPPEAHCHHYFEIQTSHQTGYTRLTRRLGGIVYTLSWARDWHGGRKEIKLSRVIFRWADITA